MLITYRRVGDFGQNKNMSVIYINEATTFVLGSWSGKASLKTWFRGFIVRNQYRKNEAEV